MTRSRSLNDAVGGLASASAWAFGARTVTILGGLALNAVLARHLTPEGFGTYVFVMAAAGVSVVVAQLGVGQTVVRVLAESRVHAGGRPSGAIASTSLWLVCESSAVVAMLAAGGSLLLRGHVSSLHVGGELILLAALLIPLMTVRFVGAELLRAAGDVRLASIFGDGMLTAITAVVVLVWVTVTRGQLSARDAVGVTAVSALVLAVAVLLAVRMRFWPVANDTARFSRRRLLGLSLPVLGANAGWVVITQGDMLALGAFRPAREVALYGAAVKFGLLIGTPLAILNAACAPAVARAFVEGDDGREKLLRGIATLAASATLCGVVVVVALGPTLLEVAFGSYYRSAAGALLLLSFGQLVNAAAGSCGIALVVVGAQAALLRISVMSAVLAFGGAVFAARTFGATGVAATAALALAGQNIAMLAALKRRAGVWSHALGWPVSFRSAAETTV